MYYIVDVYSPYDKNDDVKYVFEYNKRLWCVREIDKFEWGQPQYDELPLDNTHIQFHIYSNLEDAIKFCRELKGII